MGQAFRDLVVWKKSMLLAAAVYELTREFPREEMYGLTSQIRRSAVSVPSNIAEGHGRLTVGEFKQFLGIARGSNYEIQTQLELAKLLKFGNLEQIERAASLSHEVGKMVWALLESL
jgi:four helix bundle protein